MAGRSTAATGAIGKATTSRSSADFQNLIHGLHEIDLHGFFDGVRNVREILLVLPRDDCLQLCRPVRRHQLLLQSGRWAGTLPRRVISPVMATSPRTGNACQGAANGGGQSDAGRRTVLGDGALGNVDMHVEVAVKIARQTERGGTRADVAHGGLRGFLHYLANLPVMVSLPLPSISVHSV